MPFENGDSRLGLSQVTEETQPEGPLLKQKSLIWVVKDCHFLCLLKHTTTSLPQGLCSCSFCCSLPPDVGKTGPYTSLMYLLKCYTIIEAFCEAKKPSLNKYMRARAHTLLVPYFLFLYSSITNWHVKYYLFVCCLCLSHDFHVSPGFRNWHISWCLINILNEYMTNLIFSKISKFK